MHSRSFLLGCVCGILLLAAVNTVFRSGAVRELSRPLPLPEDTVVAEKLGASLLLARPEKKAKAVADPSPEKAMRSTVPAANAQWRHAVADPAFAEFVERYAKVAQAEEAKFGIPASVTLAQAALEGDCGRSFLARSANNHFGIKCFSKRCPKGHCVNKTDDSHKDFFVKYQSAWASFRAHSKLLVSGYGKGMKGKGWSAWCDRLQGRYATAKDYGPHLKYLIEAGGLAKYDRR